MFTIDLLKGRGIPVKAGPKDIAVLATTFAIPAVTLLIMLGYYTNNSITMATQRQKIINCQTRIDGLADAAKLQESFEKQKNTINGCVGEVACSIGEYTQWSPILKTVVENMPDSIVLTNLEVKQYSVKRKLPQKDDPQKTVDVTVPAKTLQIKVAGIPQSNCDKAVKDFQDRLRLSPALGPQIEDIRVSQKSEELDGREVISYDIDCMFKPKL